MKKYNLCAFEMTSLLYGIHKRRKLDENFCDEEKSLIGSFVRLVSGENKEAIDGNYAN
jgi:hypothetical protein